MSSYRTPSISAYYWRAFYTFSRAEKKCERRLEEKKIDVFLPVQTVVRQWKDRKKKVQEPLFRNYIFARVDERERIQVLSTPGIVRCIAFGGVPVIVTEEEIEQIRLLQSHPGNIERVETPARLIGSNVKIESGSMRGLKGKVIETRGKTRLIVQITSLNIDFKVDVPYSFTKSA